MCAGGVNTFCCCRHLSIPGTSLFASPESQPAHFRKPTCPFNVPFLQSLVFLFPPSLRFFSLDIRLHGKRHQLPWREAVATNHLDDKVDSDQKADNKELSPRWGRPIRPGQKTPPARRSPSLLAFGLRITHRSPVTEWCK